MGKLIDEQTAYDVLTDYYHHSTDTQHAALKEALEMVPTVDAVPVRHGRWQWISSTYDRIPCEKRYWCSKCHHETITHDSEPWERFCPNCGARMDGKDGDGNG